MIPSDSDRLPQARKLQDLCTQLHISVDIASHRPTFSAVETQAVLPKGCLVQKSVTDRIGDRCALWTGVGDYRITRQLCKAANKRLGLPIGSDHTLNPPDIDPVAFYGMKPGMVSPFIARESRAAHELAALLIVNWKTTTQNESVAISLSLTESLIIELKHLDKLLHAYTQMAYGYMPIYKLYH